MIDSLNIGQVIYNKLSTSNEINEILNNKIYPIVAIKRSNEDIGSLLPFIIYSRDGLIPRSTKDGIYEDTVQFTIKIVTSNYTQGIDITTLVRNIFEGRKIIYDNITISDTVLTNAYEEYNDNYSAYVQSLRFTTKIS